MTTVITTSGRVRGSIVDGVHRFLGIPYAAAPQGELRFAAAKPSSWHEIRDATVHSPIAPQVKRGFPGVDMDPILGAGQPQDGDYLTVNVYSPDPGAGSLPVMVFIHGGAFTIGAGSAPVYEGTAFAKRAVVYVSINYRLGIDGFLPIPGGETNLGLRDQIAALAWVRDNAAAFGGDAGNITVFGESAGAISVACLLGSPLARGLFRRAIVQSGHPDMVRPVAVAGRLTDRVAELLGVPATASAFRDRSTVQLLAAQAAATTPGQLVDLRDASGFDPAYRLAFFVPVIGDEVLPVHPRQNLNAEVDVIAGNTAEELRLYLVPSGIVAEITDEQAVAMLEGSRPDAADVLQRYGLGGSESAGSVLVRAMTDLVFADGARRLAAEHPGRSFGYQFDWRSPLFEGELGACHGIELPFVFDTLAAWTGPQGLVGENPPQEVATQMNQTWVRFAQTGDPGWTEAVHHIGAQSSSIAL